MDNRLIRKKKFSPVVLLLVLALAAGILALAKNSARPDILLITIDSLRADHLGCYGYARDTSPNIDALAKEGAVFLNCFAVSSGTAYSFPSLLTGQYLSVDEGYDLLDYILGDKFVTLAEHLRRAGYYTAAFVDNAHLSAGEGFEQGFDIYSAFNEKNADRVNGRVFRFLDTYRRNKPFFIWVHYLDTHVPYTPVPEGCLETFMRDRLYGEGDKILKLETDPARNPYTSWGYIPRAAFQEGHFNLNHYIACYDCQIRQTDMYLGELLKKIHNRTLIILTADHGESLGEHQRYFAHEENIYDELLHVPLIIKDSGYFRGGSRVASAASAVDIVPTILSRIQPAWYFFNRHSFDGIDLSIPVQGKVPGRRYLYSYCPWARSIRDTKNNMKYISYRAGREELFFLPDEETNHMADVLPEPIRVKKVLAEAMRAWGKDHPLRADANAVKVQLDEQRKKTLKHLGYLQ